MTSEACARRGNARAYTIGEEIANAATHGLGIGLSIAALVLLVVTAARTGDGLKIASAIVFGGALVLEYTASTLYHSLPGPLAKHVFKILDHCGIYVLIAGTYTPFALVTLRGRGGWLLLLTVWALAVIGIGAEAFWAYRPRWLSALTYLGMGWMVVFATRPLAETLDPQGLSLLVAGGLAYTVGTVFYVLKWVKFIHAVWHLFVIAGSTLHFFAVLLYVLR